MVVGRQRPASGEEGGQPVGGGIMVESAYLSRRLDIRPDQMVEVASRWSRGLAHRRRPFGRVCVRKGFWLDPETRDSASTLKMHGVVWAYGRPVPVILEFTAWSKTKSEVGVCPRTLAWPVGTAGYVRVVLLALGSMSEALCAWAHAVVSIPPAPVPAGYRESLAPRSTSSVIAVLATKA
jgi:hypothetical protein